MLIIESPPSSKKLSSTPTSFIPSTPPHISHNFSSTQFPAFSYSFSRSISPSSLPFNSCLSTFPLAVSGYLSIYTYLEGIMYSGNRLLRYPLNSPTPGRSSPPLKYATSRFPRSPSSFATTTASSTPPCPLNTASTSPTSTRLPRIFTCSSTLPTNSMFPSLIYLPISPVLYIRSPIPPLYGFGTNFSPVIPPSLTYPLPTPSPPIYISPTTPIGA